jgi:hypothetical protein
MRIRRGGTIAAAVLAGLVIGATVVRRHNNPGVPLLPGPARRQALAEAKLRVVLPEVRFRGTTLERALQELQSRSGVTFVVDWDAIDVTNVNRRDDPVDLSLTNVTVEQALKALLGYVNGGRLVSAEYTLFDGAVVITTDAEAGKYVYAAVYDLRELEVFPPPQFDARSQGVAPAYGSGLFGTVQQLQKDVSPRVEADDEITRLIEETVAPGTGRTGGVVRTFGGRVVAVTTWQNHRQIANLVSQLREPSR